MENLKINDLMSHKQVIVIRKDLNMSVGKAIAQGAHASGAAIFGLMKKTNEGFFLPNDPRINPWLEGKFKKITVEAKNEQHLKEIYEKAKEKKIPCSLILDSGLTEFNEPTYTAVAVGPDEEKKINKITGNLKLLKEI